MIPIASSLDLQRRFNTIPFRDIRRLIINAWRRGFRGDAIAMVEDFVPEPAEDPP